MADQIKIGNQHYPKMAVFGGVGLVLIAAVIYYRKKQQAAAANAQQASVTAASTNEIDPATGYAYGSAEDAAALQTQGNYQDPSQNYGYYGYGVSGGSNTQYPYQTNQPGGFVSNAQWAQYVEGYEENTMGADPTTVGNAIGKYITGQPLTNDTMVSIVQSAIAIGGYPPVSGPNGNPPGYSTGQASSTVPPPTSTKTTPTNNYHTPGSISNLQATKSGTTGRFSWNAASGNPSSYAYALTEMNGVVVKKGTTKATSMSFPNLHKGWTYNFGIQALPGGEGNNVHLTI